MLSEAITLARDNILDAAGRSRLPLMGMCLQKILRRLESAASVLTFALSGANNAQQ